MVVQTKVSFEDIRFVDVGSQVKATFQRNYYFLLEKERLVQIADFEVVDGALVFFEREKRVFNKFNPLLDEGLAALRLKLRDKPCLYVHRGSGIPLIGSNEFGLVDRGSNILEVKPLTGCNLSCSFCSVDEGDNQKRDLLVQEEYLIDVFKDLARLKKHPVEANIGPQGEPLLYPRLVDLVSDLKATGASVVSMNTNGTLLFPKLIDELAAAGLDRINLSLHALDQEKNDELMGGVQNLKRLLEMVRYCEGKVDVLLAPVLMQGFNDDQLDGIIQLAKGIRNRTWPPIGIQNFLEYQGGRNPGAIERSWDEFYAILQAKEVEHGVDLTLKGAEAELFAIHKEATLPKPFRKGDVVDVEVVALGRNRGEFLGVAKDRVITLRRCRDARVGGRLKVKLLRDKHNIFTAVGL